MNDLHSLEKTPLICDLRDPREASRLEVLALVENVFEKEWPVASEREYAGL